MIPYANGYSYRRKITIDHTKVANLTYGTHAINFERSSSQYAVIHDAFQTGLDITGDLTIEAWVKMESISSANHTIVAKDVSGSRGYNFFLNTSTIGFIIDTTLVTQAHEITTSGWHHIVIAYDASAGSVEYYVDGVSKGTDTGLPTSIPDSSANFSIGASGFGDYFDGPIKDVRIWSDVRTDAEIADNYQDYLSISPGTDNLVENWKFDNSYASESGNNGLSGVNSPTMIELKHSNFPALFNDTYEWLADTSNGGKVTSSAGNDIRFELPDGTKLDHELVSYDNTTGEIEAWIEIPELQWGSDTQVYVYYGKSGASAEENPGGVWNDSELVYHFEPLIEDSSGNDTDLTNNNTIATDSDSKIGSGPDFGAGNTTKYFNIGSFSNPMSTQTVTISLWAKRGTEIGSGAAELIDYRWDNGSDSLRLNLEYQYNSGTRRLTLGINDISHGNTYHHNVTLGTDWHKIVIKYDKTLNRLYLYLDNVLVINQTWTAAGDTGWGDVLEIGRFWDRYMDEVNISNVARDYDWLTGEYNNQNSPNTFIEVGGVEYISPFPSHRII